MDPHHHHTRDWHSAHGASAGSQRSTSAWDHPLSSFINWIVQESLWLMAQKLPRWWVSQIQNLWGREQEHTCWFCNQSQTITGNLGHKVLHDHNRNLSQEGRRSSYTWQTLNTEETLTAKDNDSRMQQSASSVGALQAFPDLLVETVLFPLPSPVCLQSDMFRLQSG